MKTLEIRKIGHFYHVFDDDCYIIYYLFRYSINNHKIGFPQSALNKVINKLEDKQINYKVLNEKIENNFKNKNNYNKYINKGKIEYQKYHQKQEIEEKIQKLSEKELKELYNMINKYINEKQSINN